MLSDCITSGGLRVDHFMAFYTKISKPKQSSNNNSTGSDLFTSMARRLTLSDDEFLIVLHNKLQHLKFEQSTIGPAIKKGVRAVLSVFGVNLRQDDSEPQKILLTGMEMQTLQRLTGFAVHEKLQLQEDYEMELPALRKLLDETKG